MLLISDLNVAYLAERTAQQVLPSNRLLSSEEHIMLARTFWCPAALMVNVLQAYETLAGPQSNVKNMLALTGNSASLIA